MKNLQKRRTKDDFGFQSFHIVKNFFVRATVFRSTFSRNGSGSTNLTLEFLFPYPNGFQTVFVSTYFANVLSFLRPLATSPISGAAISNKSAPILFAAGTSYFLIMGIAVLPRVCATAPKPLPRCLACPQKIGKIEKNTEQENNSCNCYGHKRDFLRLYYLLVLS